MTPETHFDREILKKLLTESLSEREESDVSEHLATCSECRSEFETLAAANEWWSEASQRLSDATIRDPDDRSAGLSSFGDDLPHFTSDFAVDFLDPSDDEQSLGRLGEYEILQVIGRGGMGIVLKGFQKELHRHVAVKVLSPHLALSGAARRRFAREAQATAAVVHPHVMAIHSVNASARLPYLVMPFVACQSLQDRIDRQGPLDVKDVLRIGMQTALGLAAAHAQGLVHRDVKPANILLESNVDRVLLTDFGLARAVDDATLTRTGIIAGTPQYMSPEQANGDNVDHRSDLFSLGAVLYAMCTGRPPFRAETTFGVLRRIRETAPRSIREINPDIPQWLERVVNRLLSKDVVERFGSADEVAGLLEQCLAHVQQPVTVPLPAEAISQAQPWDWRNHRAWLLIAGIVCVIAIAGIAGREWWQNHHPMTAVGRLQKSLDENSGSKLSESPSDLSTSTRWDSVNVELDTTERLIDLLEVTVEDDAVLKTSKDP